MSDQSDSSRFEPPVDGSGPQPDTTSTFDQPFAGEGNPTQELPTSGATTEIPAPAAGSWTAGTADNPYESERFTFDASLIRPSGDPPADSAAGGGGRRLAMMGLGATAVAAVILGGGYLAYDQVLGGGGAQPESVIPANAIAFAKVDLDPSGGQKIDALRFARKFPKAPADVKKDDADLRKVIFEQIQEGGHLEGVDYAKDVQPWLGSRFGVAAVPGAAGDEPVALVALAVTDVAKAKAGLAKLSAEDGNTHCSVGEAYALCGEDATAVAAAFKSGQTASLKDAKAFSSDVDSLGEDGIVSFWADLSRAKELAGSMGTGGVGTLTAQYQGRFFGALRFDGPTLELVGKGAGLADSGVSGDENGVRALPADTLAAFGLSGGREYAQKLWGNLEKSGLTGDVESMASDSDLSLPGDLQTLLGNSFAVAFGGMGAGEDALPKVALVTDSGEADVKALAGKVEPLLGTPFAVKAGGGRTVVALEQDYADAVASGTGLGDKSEFTDAVPDADSASVVLYADIAGLVKSFGADLGDDDRKLADVFRSVGISAGAKGNEADFRMRLTTN